MSLINQVLRDLDLRKAGRPERSGLPSHTRALPPEKNRPWKPLALLAAGALSGAGLVWVALNLGETSIPPQPRPQASPLPALPPLLPVSLPQEPSPPDPVAPQLKLETTIPPARPAPPRPARAVVPESVPAAPSREIAVPSAAVEKSSRAPLASEAAESEYRKAMAAYKRGAMTETLGGLHHALQLDPRHAQARQALLSVLVDQRQWKEAQAAAEEGLALDPRQAGWAMILARLEVEQGQLAKAVETLARHAPHAERNPEYLAFHALLLQKSGRSREAAERYRAALTLKADDGRWWYGLGLALEAEGHPQEARIAYQRAKDSGNLPTDLSGAVEQKVR